jgi:ATP-dependent Lon protease
VARIVAAAETLANLIDRIPDEVPQILKMNVSDPGRFADLAATNMNFRISDKDEVLQRLDVGQRLQFILSRLEREVGRARVMEDVKRTTEVKIEQHQREFYLRQQLRAIQTELGETDPGEKEAIEMLKKIDEAQLPERAGQEARREVERLRMLSPASSEYQVIRTYLDWILALPWNKKTGTEEIELKKSRKRSTRATTDSTRPRSASSSTWPFASCAAATHMDRSSVSSAAGHGEDIVRLGHRDIDRPRVLSHRGRRRAGRSRDSRAPAHVRGAMPGLLIQALRRVGVRDPVMMIDEIDKMAVAARRVTRPRRCSRCSTRRRTTTLSITTSTCSSTCRRSVHHHRQQPVRHPRPAA